MSNDLAALKHWIEVVRDKERGRGLDADQQVSWEEGREVWAAFYPNRASGGRLKDAMARFSRFVRPPSRRR